MGRRKPPPAPERSSRLSRRLGALAVRCAVWLLATLPGFLAYLLVDLLVPAVVVISTLREWRVGRGVDRNLRIAFRELSKGQRRRLRWRWARHMMWFVVDFCRLPKIQADNLDRHVDVSEVAALEELAAAVGRVRVGRVRVPWPDPQHPSPQWKWHRTPGVGFETPRSA